MPSIPLLLLGSLLAIVQARSDVDPVIIIPGITGSRMQAKLEDRPAISGCGYFCKTTSDWYEIWVSLEQLALRPCCVIRNLQLGSVDDDGCTSETEGVTVRAVGWGDVDGIEIINPGDVSAAKIVVWKVLLDAMREKGYVANQTLRSAPYDWRVFGDSCWTTNYFNRLQALIEETVTATSRKVKLVCHSMGCTAAKVFLAKHVDHEWKQQNVAGLLGLGGTWAGAGNGAASIVNGPTTTGVPAALSHFGRDMSGTWPSLLALLPFNATVWGDGNIVSTPRANYTVHDMRKLVLEAAAEAPELAFIAKYVKWYDENLWSGEQGVGVPVNCVYLTDTQTASAFHFASDTWADLSKMQTVATTDGDGSVNALSANHLCKQFGGLSIPLSLGGKYDHVGMLTAPDVIDAVMSFAKHIY